MLAALAPRARALPTILSGLTTGLLSGGINKAISHSGDGLYLHKHDKCYRVQKCKGNGLYLAPHLSFVEDDGLFLKHGNYISDGAGLLMGKNSPDGYCNYLFRRDVQNKVFYLSSLSLTFIVEQYG